MFWNPLVCPCPRFFKFLRQGAQSGFRGLHESESKEMLQISLPRGLLQTHKTSPRTAHKHKKYTRSINGSERAPFTGDALQSSATCGSVEPTKLDGCSLDVGSKDGPAMLKADAGSAEHLVFVRGRKGHVRENMT